jgi:hypothetical protein
MPKPNRKRKPHQPAPRKNTKVTGESCEAAFLYFASGPLYNFGIAKPWGDSRRYDFILDNGRRLYRIQVKCTESLRAGAYEVRAAYSLGKGRAVYTKDDIDFIAVLIIPLNLWYIIPVEVCTPRPMLRFYPHRTAKKMRLEKYREAWHLLQSPEATGKDDAAKEESRSGKIDLQARADESTYEDCHSEHSGMIRPSESSPESRNLLLPTTPVTLPAASAPWPIPPLQILATRKGRQILPHPPPR